MEYSQIINDLKKKVYRPIYFLMGEEPYYIDKIADFIEASVLDESEKEFNQTILYGRDVDMMTIISTAKRYPMMANHQVVIVREAQNLRNIIGSESDDDGEKEKTNPFAAYLENPLKSTVLVFCYKYKTIDKRKKIAKTISEKAVLFESKKLYENKIPDWINDYLKEKNYIIGQKASMLLTEFLGNDLQKISNELDKLMLNIPVKTEITAAHIEMFIGISKDYNNFELQNALCKKDALKANRIINYFANNPKANPMVLTISALFSYYTKILIYHYLKNKSDNKLVAAALKVHPFFVNEYQNAARNYSPEKTKQVVGLLREYDLKSKGLESNAVSDGELLKELIYKIIH